MSTAAVITKPECEAASGNANVRAGGTPRGQFSAR